MAAAPDELEREQMKYLSVQPPSLAPCPTVSASIPLCAPTISPLSTSMNLHITLQGDVISVRKIHLQIVFTYS